MGVLMAFLLPFFLSGCTPEKRLARIVKKNPHLLEKDTLTITDTVTLDRVSVDSVSSIYFDTLYLEKERLSIRIVRVNDSIYIHGESRGDTVFIERKIPINRVIVKELTLWEKYNWLLWVFLALLVLYLFKRVLR